MLHNIIKIQNRTGEPVSIFKLPNFQALQLVIETPLHRASVCANVESRWGHVEADKAAVTGGLLVFPAAGFIIY